MCKVTSIFHISGLFELTVTSNISLSEILKLFSIKTSQMEIWLHLNQRNVCLSKMWCCSIFKMPNSSKVENNRIRQQTGKSFCILDMQNYDTVKIQSCLFSMVCTHFSVCSLSTFFFFGQLALQPPFSALVPTFELSFYKVSIVFPLH